MNLAAIKSFHKLCLYTLIAVYFLIGVGSVVRSTGSGMGCPDWPRCFGSWVPPTSVEQLPTDYKQTNAAFREAKNKKFAKYLQLIGLNSTAEKILTDPSVLQEAEFNPVKTWIEYANRLVGVTIGIFIVALFGYSFKLRAEQPKLFWMSLVVLILVIFQGWFGSIVVSTNLTGWTITVHMFLALLMVSLLAYLFSITSPAVAGGVSNLGVRLLLVLSMVLLLIQIFLGTQVREGIDLAVSRMLPRSEWIASVGSDFIVHRTFSWIVLLVNLFLVRKFWKMEHDKPLFQVVVVLILTTLITGIGMAYFSVPAFLQPVHLLVATLTFGMQLIIFFRLMGWQGHILKSI